MAISYGLKIKIVGNFNFCIDTCTYMYFSDFQHSKIWIVSLPWEFHVHVHVVDTCTRCTCNFASRPGVKATQLQLRLHVRLHCKPHRIHVDIFTWDCYGTSLEQIQHCYFAGPVLDLHLTSSRTIPGTCTLWTKANPVRFSLECVQCSPT